MSGNIDGDNIFGGIIGTSLSGTVSITNTNVSQSTRVYTDGNNRHVGGFIGDCNAALSVHGSTMAGVVHSGDYVGGLIGRVTNHEAVFHWSHFTGRLEFRMGTQYKGGFIGIPTTTRFHDCTSTGRI